MSEQTFDLVAVGTGVASVAARKCARRGWKVGLIDERPPGGTCALRGCTPKKILRTGAEALDFARRMHGKGVLAADIGRSWSDLRRFMKDYTDPIPTNNKKIYENEGITFFDGTARFLAPDLLAVRAPSGEETMLRAEKFFLATGSHPSKLSLPGVEHIISSDDFFELEELPRRMVFLGAGFISMEFAHIAAKYGAECTVVQRRANILTAFEPFLTEKLRVYSEEKHGISFRLNSQATAIEKTGNGCTVKLRCSDGTESSIESDLVVHGAGRTPNVESLELEKGEVEYTAKGITVNEFLRSPSNPRVYAAGDCADTGSPHLTLVAAAEGNTVFDNLLNGDKTRTNYEGVAAVVFTLPGLASAGMTEAQAREAGYDIKVREDDTARWFTNRLLNWEVGGYKIIMEKETHRILGAHFLGHRCEEFINIFALAIRHHMSREDLKRTLWAHPSSASDMGRILG